MAKADISVNVGEHLLNYRVSAIIKKKNKVLVHHSIGSEHFTLPGGRVKEGESSIEALQREIKEEMDLETEYIRPVSFIENFFIMKGKEYHELLMTHELKFKNEKIYAKDRYEPAEPEKKGKLEFLWIDIENIDNLNFVPEAMKKVLKENKHFEHIVNNDMPAIEEKLKIYIENEVFPQYKLNGKSHGLEHIKGVINRAMEIAKKYHVNYNILYTAAAYHDIGDHIDREHHEIVSAQMMYADKKLDEFFDENEKRIIKEAIEDHRASSGREPRSIYGKILTSADKNIDIDDFFERSIAYGLEHYKELNKRQQIERAYEHAVEKFGINGYATITQYVENKAYDNYLKELRDLIQNREEFDKKASEIYDKLTR